MKAISNLTFGFSEDIGKWHAYNCRNMKHGTTSIEQDGRIYQY